MVHRADIDEYMHKLLKLATSVSARDSEQVGRVRKTKIICTVGPATSDQDKLAELVDCRGGINDSRGSTQDRIRSTAR